MRQEGRTSYTVIKRDGTEHSMDLDKVATRLSKLTFGLDQQFLNIPLIVEKVSQGVFNRIKTSELDNLAAETCAYMNLIHPHYSVLAARTAVDSLAQVTPSSIKDVANSLYNCKDESGRDAPLLSLKVFEVISQNYEKIDKTIDLSRDFNFDYFGFKTLERSYLLKVNGKIAERPQHMFMRVSIGIHQDNLQAAFETYDLMSRKYFTHATPTLYNSGTPNCQMSSCFLLSMKDDSIDGIYDTLTQCAKISKSAGGIGIAISNIRAKGSYIRGTNGTSNGIIPMLKVFNDTARYVDQGGGKRKGSFAVYLEPWHSDVFDFLDMRKNTGKEENRARDLFYGLWIPDLFMRRVEQNAHWTLMCPNECPGLMDVWGDQFDKLYKRYETQGKGRKQIEARTLWEAIISAQTETGTPYVLFKDTCNRKSNQQNLGTIRCSNLCTEIVQFTSPDEVAVCNLASISLPTYVRNGEFDIQELVRVTRIITRNLNKIIDINSYPVKEARNSNLKHRPIGIGVQGLADIFQMLGISFESKQAKILNEKIFEAIYYGAVTQSIALAKMDRPYQSYAGSPTSKGLLQFDLWDYSPHLCGFDWKAVKDSMKAHGIRNSLLVAPMPTASTSQILGNNEAFEPYTTNVYTRRVLAGQFVCINKHLVDYLIQRKLWSPEVRDLLIAHNGSVQKIDCIASEAKELFKTVWEISQKELINLAIGRGPFIDQSQSLNVFMSEPNYNRLCSAHFHAWKGGLKTGMYYLRSRPAADPIKFTVDVENLLKQASGLTETTQEVETDGSPNKKVKACPLRRPGMEPSEVCDSCGS